jgi:hypothetical protein
MKRTLIAGLATAALVSGGLDLAGLGLGAGTAHADRSGRWCPGQDLLGSTGPGDVVWDMHVCHTWSFVGYGPGPDYVGLGNVPERSGNPSVIWDGDNPPGTTPPQCNAPGLPPCGLFP